MSHSMRAGALTLALVILSFIVSLGCGGGGIDPVVPDENQYQPVPPPPPVLPTSQFLIVPITGDVINCGGTYGWQGNATVGVWSQFQVRIDILYQGNWVPVDVAPMGYRLALTQYSGSCPATSATIPYDRDWRGGWLVKIYPFEVSPGFLDFQLTVVDQNGKTLNADPVMMRFNIHPANEEENPPPPPTCRDLHPVKEAIAGYWWDCVDDCWVNTGVPVNPPPVTYTLHIYGAQGEFTEGATIDIDEGNGYQLQVWELVGSDDSQVSLSGANAIMESSVLPFWCWEPTPREIMTALWANPEYPNSDEPGNIFINPGVYDINFTISHSGTQYHRSGYVEVVDRPDFP